MTTARTHATPWATVAAIAAAQCLAAPRVSGQMFMSDPDERPPPVLSEYPDLPAVDGDISDWPEKGYALADEKHLAIRFRVQQPISLQSAPAPIVVRIDVDDDRGTGRPQARLGVDLDIVFSDNAPTEDGRRRYGPTILAHPAGGEPVELTPYDIGLEWAPTHASEWFELRINRRGKLAEVLGIEGLGTTGRAWVSLYAMGGQPVEPDFRFMWTLLPPDPVEPGNLDATIPAKPDNGLRVISWNVLWGSPQRDPAPFRRILDATGPDVILFQEWDRAEQSEEQIAEWLNTHHSRPDIGSWTVERSDAWGVAVATPHPVIARGPDELFAPGTRWDFSVRYAAAAIDTPLGVLAAASVHYKCCAGVGSREDIRRLVEAEAVNDELGAFAESVGADFTLIGGDFNMGGTAAVATISYAGLDADGSPLTEARAAVLGDDVLSTFGRPDRGSSGARLDFIGYPDSVLTVANAFVLDTNRLSAASLERQGLLATDTHASDHRPVVVDLVAAGRD